MRGNGSPNPQHQGLSAMILVLDNNTAAASRLKSMIEFMDAPPVVTATPASWRSSIDEAAADEQRLDAVFLGATLSDAEITAVVDGVGEIDPNASIVIVDS